MLFTNLSGATSIAEVQERLGTRRQDALEHGMMLGFNLEPDRLRERRYPTRHELDSAIPEKPIFVYRVDGHSAGTATDSCELPGREAAGHGRRL
jgi:hypothetical protein